MADLLLNSTTTTRASTTTKNTPTKRDRKLKNGRTFERNKTPKHPKDPKAHRTPTARSIRREILLKEQLELDTDRPGVLQLSNVYGGTRENISVSFWATRDTADNVSYEAAKGITRELAVGGGFGPDTLPIKKQEEALAEQLNRHLGTFERQVERKRQQERQAPHPLLIGNEMQFFEDGSDRTLKLIAVSNSATSADEIVSGLSFNQEIYFVMKDLPAIQWQGLLTDFNWMGARHSGRRMITMTLGSLTATELTTNEK